MKRLLALALFAAASLAHAHGYAVGELKIDHPWARATPGAAKNGAAYLTVSNTGKQADRLVAVHAAWDHRCGAVAQGAVLAVRTRHGSSPSTGA